MRFKRLIAFAAVLAAAFSANAHDGVHPSIHDTVSGIVQRLGGELGSEELVALSVDKAESLLTAEEREILSTQYLRFRVSVPVVVSVIRDARLGGEPFWLEDRGFEKTKLQAVVDRQEFDVWQKAFDAGEVGLGVNSLSGNGDHYFVAVRTRGGGDSLAISEMYPGYHTVGTVRRGVRVYCDDDETLDSVSSELEGQTLIRGADDRCHEAQIIGVFLWTDYPSSEKPDHVVLTWSDDPRTTQTVQWRTNTSVGTGAVSYVEKAHYATVNPAPFKTASAVTKALETPDVVNDPAVHWHTATLTGLEPGTTYVYAVGDGSDGGWSELREFTTAPAGAVPFSFVYMGDAQNGLERWGSLIQNAYRHRPDAAFYVMAGDLVNRGNHRNEWDTLFQMAKGVYDRRPVVPALGNHEYQHGQEPELYLEHFTLPVNGPDSLAAEKAYAIRYSNALFVVLDSNLPAREQTEWLEEQLAGTDATWKFVVYHHPAYSSSPSRNNPEIRKLWGALFDKYHVDLALQGHDHAYLRTYPMKDEKRAESPADGTIYIVSVSGTKYYDQGEFDYTEFGMKRVSTYQALDIQIHGDRLVYRSYDIDGHLRDEFVIEK